MIDAMKAFVLLNNFIYEKLSGDIDRLVSFNFSELKNDKKYGCPDRDFDEDDTELAKSIYYLLWGGEVLPMKLPELTYDQIGTGKKYRGDTLNTFNTLFGGENIYDYDGIQETGFAHTIKIIKQKSDNVFVNRIYYFKNECYTIGNFSVLPNNSITIDNNKTTTINCYRGVGSGWSDYYDRFLLELKKCLENAPDKDKTLDKLVKANSFYFDNVNSIEKFCKVNLLYSFYLENKSLNLFPKKYTFKNINADDYEEFASEYMAKSEHTILLRSLYIITVLKRIFNRLLPLLPRFYLDGINDNMMEITNKKEHGIISEEEARIEHTNYMKAVSKLIDDANKQINFTREQNEE